MKKLSEREKNLETMKRGKLNFRHKGGVTRKLYTAPWDDDVFKGTMHILQVYGRLGIPLSDKQIGKLIYWGDKAVKNVRLLKLKHSCAQNWIQRITYEGRECNLLDRGKCDINLYELCSIIDDSYYKTKFGPNRPEAIVGRLYNSFAPNEWKYTGDQRKEHKIGRCYPDYTHMQYKAVTEIFGDFYHGEDFTGVPVHINEAKKIKAYDKMKYKCLQR